MLVFALCWFRQVQGLHFERHLYPRKQPSSHDFQVAVHADMRFHPEVPFVTLHRLVHFGIALSGQILKWQMTSAVRASWIQLYQELRWLQFPQARDRRAFEPSFDSGAEFIPSEARGASAQDDTGNSGSLNQSLPREALEVGATLVHRKFAHLNQTCSAFDATTRKRRTRL